MQMTIHWVCALEAPNRADVERGVGPVKHLAFLRDWVLFHTTGVIELAIEPAFHTCIDYSNINLI